ncbi:MAG: DUF4373 domain-containing protein [Candidatus Cloacimonetes bacterium]|nr:DUF4373 domain-containing protein [Candidatus Cloacimonadota bacterium]
MSRPRKAVADYFPHFVSHGKTMYTIENKYGNDGYAFWFKLLEQLGGAEHHFLDCNKPGTWEYLLAKTNIKDETAITILDMCAKLDAINQDVWKYKIIRSDNLIANLDSLYKRREVSVLSNEEVLSLCNHKLCISSVSVNKNPQSEVNDSSMNQNIKAETDKMEQEQEEGISKGNPRNLKKSAGKSNSKIKKADYEERRLKEDLIETQPSPSPVAELESHLQNNLPTHISDGKPADIDVLTSPVDDRVYLYNITSSASEFECKDLRDNSTNAEPNESANDSNASVPEQSKRESSGLVSDGDW